MKPTITKKAVFDAAKQHNIEAKYCGTNNTFYLKGSQEKPSFWIHVVLGPAIPFKLENVKS